MGSDVYLHMLRLSDSMPSLIMPVTEKATPFVTVHITVNSTYLYDIVIASTYAEWLAGSNSLKVQFHFALFSF